MSFIDRHNTVTIHTQLTQEGRKRLADGDLSISKIAYLDSEMDYSFGSSGQTYDHNDNSILSYVYRHAASVTRNYDGTDPFILSSDNVFTTTEVVKERIPSIGFYSSTTNTEILSDYRLKNELSITTGYTHTYLSSPPLVRFALTPNWYRLYLSGATSVPPENGLMFIRFNYPYGDSVDPFGPNIGYNANIYRYRYFSASSLIEVDRFFPRFDLETSIDKIMPVWLYPLSGYSNYYGSGTTEPCPIWNMNILSQVPQVGHQPASMEPNTIVFGIGAPPDVAKKKYGSKNISGIVKKLGLNDLSRCGVIHYTNSFSGSVYGDQLSPNETVVDVPHILWHRNNENINGSSLNGGLKLTDENSEIIFDVRSGCNYTILRDGNGPSSQEVGRVYFEKKLIVITDQELLTAMDPKSNRNWTYPKLDIDLVSVADNNVINANGYIGITQPGKKYYVTYQIYSFTSSLLMYGVRISVPCSYISEIDGALDEYGNPMFIRASFPANSFPFIRDDMNNFSGSGINSARVSLLVQEVDIEDDPGINGLHPDKWRTTLNLGVSHFIPSGTIFSADELNQIVMYSTRNEYDDYFTYYRFTNFEGGGMGQNLGFDRAFWPGDTDFLFGNVSATSVRKKHYRNIHHLIDSNMLNSTTNSTYTSGSTFITQIALLDSNNRVLGIGKPDRPIKKNSSTIIDLTLKSYY